MAAVDVARAVASAERMIARYGAAGILRRSTSSGPSYDPTMGTPTDTPVMAAVVDFSQGEISSTVLVTDKKVMLAKGVLTTDPSITDVLLIGGETFQIIPPLMTISREGVPICYQLQCRR